VPTAAVSRNVNSGSFAERQFGNWNLARRERKRKTPKPCVNGFTKSVGPTGPASRLAGFFAWHLHCNLSFIISQPETIGEAVTALRRP
jgi:hypothetical protein